MRNRREKVCHVSKLICTKTQCTLNSLGGSGPIPHREQMTDFYQVKWSGQYTDL